jgi:hypothetical protein
VSAESPWDAADACDAVGSTVELVAHADSDKSERTAGRAAHLMAEAIIERERKSIARRALPALVDV